MIKKRRRRIKENDMVRAAIVEDEPEAANLLRAMINRYFEARGGDCTVTVFDNALRFLDVYKADFDIVFMDIEMPDLDGMRAAEQLRKLDPLVLLVFVTNMQQYAVKGYAVDALDFVVKPIEQRAFFALLDKAVRILSNKPGAEITVRSMTGVRRISAARIRYVEVRRHRLTFHTEDGEFEAWGNLRDIEKELPSEMFSRCNIGYLVSLQHVSGVDGDDVVVCGDRLKISRPRRKEFMSDLANYFGSGR